MPQVLGRFYSMVERWEQLTLPGVELEWQAVVPIEPPPWQTTKAGVWFGGSFFAGDWNWEYSPGVTACASHPERSVGWLRNSPFQPGMGHGDGVIESVRVAHISTGWVWVLTLRDYRDNDLVPFWEAIRPGRRCA